MPKKTASVSAVKTAKKPGRPPSRGVKSARRTPYEIVSQLKARRAELAKTYEGGSPSWTLGFSGSKSATRRRSR